MNTRPPASEPVWSGSGNSVAAERDVANERGVTADCKWYAEGMQKPFSRARLVWGRWDGSLEYTVAVKEAMFLGYRRGMLVGAMMAYALCMPFDLLASVIRTLESLPAAKRGYYPTVQWRPLFGRGLSLIVSELTGLLGAVVGAPLGTLYWCARAVVRLALRWCAIEGERVDDEDIGPFH
jgi:hypothetical protein